MEKFNLLKKNPIFKFVSSVKLAVPLMLTQALIVAVGTIFESRYNSEYAKLMIYNSGWFAGLMGLLWINIFCWDIKKGRLYGLLNCPIKTLFPIELERDLGIVEWQFLRQVRQTLKELTKNSSAIVLGLWLCRLNLIARVRSLWDILL